MSFSGAKVKKKSIFRITNTHIKNSISVGSPSRINEVLFAAVSNLKKDAIKSKSCCSREIWVDIVSRNFE